MCCQQQLCPKSPGAAGTGAAVGSAAGRKGWWRTELYLEICFIICCFNLWAFGFWGPDPGLWACPPCSPIDAGIVTVMVPTKTVHQVQTCLVLPTIPQIPPMHQFGATWPEMSARIFHLGQSKPFQQFPCSAMPKVQFGMLITLVCVSSLLTHGHIQSFWNLSKKNPHSKRISPPWNP